MTLEQFKIRFNKLTDGEKNIISATIGLSDYEDFDQAGNEVYRCWQNSIDTGADLDLTKDPSVEKFIEAVSKLQ